MAKRTVKPQCAPAPKPRGNVVTTAELKAARPLAFACLALVEHDIAGLYWWDNDPTDEVPVLHAPSELLTPLP